MALNAQYGANSLCSEALYEQHKKLARTFKLEGNVVNSGELVVPAAELASRWQRFGAAFIDGIVYAVVVLPLMYILGLFDGASQGRALTVSETVSMQLIGMICFVVINGHLLAKYGQTVGKRVVGIQVVALDYSKVAMKQLVIRYAVYFLIGAIPLIGGVASFVNLLFIFGAEKRCGHDYAADTRVVQCAG